MDKVIIQILEDGTIKTSTDKISMANHQNCEGFLRDVAKLAGGEVTRRNKAGAVAHAHAHGNEFHEH